MSLPHRIHPRFGCPILATSVAFVSVASAASCLRGPGPPPAGPCRLVLLPARPPCLRDCSSLSVRFQAHSSSSCGHFQAVTVSFCRWKTNHHVERSWRSVNPGTSNFKTGSSSVLGFSLPGLPAARSQNVRARRGLGDSLPVPPWETPPYTPRKELREVKGLAQGHTARWWL